MYCLFESCKYLALPDHDYCHLKSHNKDEELLQEAIENFQQQFRAVRMPPSTFYIHNVAKDGACFFRVMANALVYNIKYIQHKCFLVKLITGKDEDVPDADLDELGLIPLNKTLETKISIALQEVARQWIIENKEKVIAEQGCSVADLVRDSHGITIDEYETLYQIFAGDPDYVVAKEETTYKSGAKKGQKRIKTVKSDIQTRWGGTVEQYALSEFFDIAIKVYVPQRVSKRTCEVVAAPLKDPTTMFYLAQITNSDILFKKPVAHVDILMTDTLARGKPHFQFLIEKK